MKKFIFLLALTFAVSLTAQATNDATNDAFQVELLADADVTVNPMMFVAVDTVTDFVTFTFVDVCTEQAEVITVTLEVVGKRTERIENRINKRCEVWQKPKTKVANLEHQTDTDFCYWSELPRNYRYKQYQS